MTLRPVLASLCLASALAAVACGASDTGSGAPGDSAPGDNPAGPTPPNSQDPPTTLGSPQTLPKPPPGADSGAPDGSPVPPVTVPPGSCGTKNPATGFLANVSLTVGTIARTYALTVPTGYDGTKLYPIVIGFHGDGGNGAGYRSSLAIEAQAPQGAIFVWPNGTNNNNGHSFDQGHDPPSNADVAFFDAMVTSISTTYCADKARVYVHGMSGGAYFTNQLGRWRSSAIRAIAPQSGGGPFGVLGSDFDATGNVALTGALPALFVHGLADTTVDISEGQKSLAYWRRADKSTPGQAATTPSPCQKQNGTVDQVVFCAIPGLNHAIWSGAPAAIWQFFAAN